MSKPDTIEAQAADWLDRIDRAALDSKDGQDFDRWMDSDVRHRRAFAEMAALWHSDDLMQASAAIVRDEVADDLPVAANDTLAQNSRARDEASVVVARGQRIGRWGIGLRLAAAAALAAFVVLPALPRDFATAPGERTQVTLADGSLVELGGNSQIEVQMLPWRRSVELVRGEASFDVAREENRIFAVQVDDTQVEVLGTQFRIDRLASGRSLIDVTSGKVRVGSQTRELVLTADQAAMSGPGELARVTLEPEQQVMSGEWFVADNTPLPDLIEKLRRFAPGKLTVASQDALEARVTGRFNVHDMNSTLYLLENIYGFRVVEVDGDIFIS
ncbi:MAG: hypothetical protein B7Y88_08450 [Sphingomonadales bacterium 32-64-17]|nr:MAG: hypothetical protein B7Y88_08450 [Sphingomonadales bacterium 32-64-17]